jgi:nucleotidyltransferase substrate binding protein (TIGR01987 family)
MADIRWQQRLQNFSLAFAQLQDAIRLTQQRDLSKLEKQGLIQAFEFTHELAWNVIKDYFEHQGNTLITGSRDATREAFKMGLISNGDVWMEMIKSRNQTAHTYNQSTADDITKKVIDLYFLNFEEFKRKMESLKVS